MPGRVLSVSYPQERFIIMKNAKNQYFFTLVFLMSFYCQASMEKDSEPRKRSFGQISSSSQGAATSSQDAATQCCLPDLEIQKDRDFKYFVKNGYFKHVETMLQEGYMPPVGGFNRILATLSMSILANETHLKMAKILTKLPGADIAALYGHDDTGQTLLLESVKRNNCDLVAWLLEAGVTVVSKDERLGLYSPRNRMIFFDRHDAILPLIHATIFKSCDMMNLLIDQGNADITATDAYGFNALMYAAISGHIDQIKILLKHGLDIEAKENQLGRTAWILAAASCNGRQEVLSYLLLQGADCNAVDKHGENALLITAGLLWGEGDYIMLLDYPITADLLYQNGSSLLHQIVKNNWKQALKKMIALVEHPELCACQHPEITGLFYRQDNAGKTALMYAAESDYRDIAAMLLNTTSGDNLEEVDKEGKTASMLAKSSEMKTFLDEYEPLHMPLK